MGNFRNFEEFWEFWGIRWKNSFIDQSPDDKFGARRNLDDKLKKVKDMEDQEKRNKFEELKRERDEMLKWAKQSKKVIFIS